MKGYVEIGMVRGPVWVDTIEVGVEFVEELGVDGDVLAEVRDKLDAVLQGVDGVKLVEVVLEVGVADEGSEEETLPSWASMYGAKRRRNESLGNVRAIIRYGARMGQFRLKEPHAVFLVYLTVAVMMHGSASIGRVA